MMAPYDECSKPKKDAKKRISRMVVRWCLPHTLQFFDIAMENAMFFGYLPIENGDFP